MFGIAVYRIPDLDCPDELHLVRKALAAEVGILALEPDYLNRQLRVRFDGDENLHTSIARAIRSAGFRVEELTDAAATHAVEPSKISAPPIALYVAGVLLVAALLLPLATTAPPSLASGLAIAATLVGSATILPAAWRAIRLRAIDMYVLIMLAAIGALVIGEFYEAALLVVLFGLSLWLENVSLGRAQRAVRKLVELTPTMVERVATGDGPPTASQGQPERVPADMLRVGDQISVKPGQLIPVDGEVVWGASDVNQAPLTGESQPIAREVGDEVFAGTWNGESPLRIRMTRPQSESVAARIGQIVQRAHASRAPIERFIDRFARRYTPAVMALAMVVAIVPPLVAPASTTQLELASFTPWIHRGLILLVIACPCALVISTPVTIVCGLARAAKKGILIQGGEFLETAAGLDALALDKTGTITRGAPSVTAVHVASGQKFADVLRIAASLEAHSSHPFALAIVDFAAGRQITPKPATDVSARTGSGLLGHVDGAACAVGSARLIKSLIGDQQPAEIATDDDHGCSRVYVLRDGELLGHILLTDPPRDDAASTLAVLNQMGVRRFVLLTGDRRTAADRLSQELQKADKQFPRAWEVQAELLPEDKAAFVRRLAEDGSCVGMVGDGINDAPALASADIGIALGSDVSDAALEVADVSILTENLGKLVDLVRLARRCLQLLRQNITFALAAKALVAVLAALGWASMGAAVLADVGASLVVVANGMRMLRA